jgi:multidrug efflux pump subunit AcrA (membrane-fusion protein)
VPHQTLRGNWLLPESWLHKGENNMNFKFLNIVILPVATAVLLSACSATGRMPSDATPTTIPPVSASGEVVAEGRLEPVRFTQLALNSSGLVSEVLNKEGAQVEAGQVIARLESSQAKSLASAQADAMHELTGAYQAVRDAQFKLDNFDVPADFSGMTPTQAVKRTLVKLNTARDNFEPYKNLSDKKLEPSGSEVDNGIYKNTAKLYKKQLDDAWARYRKAIQWLDLESALDTAQAQLEQAQKNNDSLQDPLFAEDTAGARAALANADVRAPFGGTITNLDLKVGEFTVSGQPVVTIADLSNWVVKTTDLTEIDVVNIREGQPVTVTLDAIPGVTLKGYVLSVGKNFAEKQGDIVYEVSVVLTDRNPGMRWGMTAEVKFGP